ncbi:MAG TPA: hypothetical protein VMB25_23940 [Bryobacteraceae bacterium]|nr:hypothetical protein [Bryobacteraceae bacterium]
MTGLFRHASLAITLAISVSLVAIARADTVSVDLSSLVNSDLTTYTGGGSYPQHGGSITVGDIPFTLATIGPDSDTAVLQTSTETGAGQIYALNVDVFGASTAYTLINSAFGECGTTVGQLVFVGSSTTYTYTLTEGVNVRDHYDGGFCNTVTDVGGTANFGSDRLDMQSIVLPSAFDDQTLETIYFQTFGQGYSGSPFLAAMTLDPAPVPEPVTWPLGLAALLIVPLAHRRWRAQQ